MRSLIPWQRVFRGIPWLFSFSATILCPSGSPRGYNLLIVPPSTVTFIFFNNFASFSKSRQSPFINSESSSILPSHGQLIPLQKVLTPPGNIKRKPNQKGKTLLQHFLIRPISLSPLIVHTLN